MSFFNWGNRGIESTTIGLLANQTTSALFAEVDLNGTNASVMAGGGVWGVTWILSNLTTGVVFLCDHASSTDVSTGGIINQFAIPMSSANSAQFYTKHNVSHGDRFRVRYQSSVTGSLGAKIIAEPLT